MSTPSSYPLSPPPSYKRAVGNLNNIRLFPLVTAPRTRYDPQEKPRPLEHPLPPDPHNPQGIKNELQATPEPLRVRRPVSHIHSPTTLKGLSYEPPMNHLEWGAQAATSTSPPLHPQVTRYEQQEPPCRDPSST